MSPRRSMPGDSHPEWLAISEIEQANHLYFYQNVSKLTANSGLAGLLWGRERSSDPDDSSGLEATYRFSSTNRKERCLVPRMLSFANPFAFSGGAGLAAGSGKIETNGMVRRLKPGRV